MMMNWNWNSFILISRIKKKLWHLLVLFTVVASLFFFVCLPAIFIIIFVNIFGLNDKKKMMLIDIIFCVCVCLILIIKLSINELIIIIISKYLGQFDYCIHWQSSIIYTSNGFRHSIARIIIKKAIWSSYSVTFGLQSFSDYYYYFFFADSDSLLFLFLFFVLDNHIEYSVAKKNITNWLSENRKKSVNLISQSIESLHIW